MGLPYFLLSTTGPLVQAWYARRFPGAMPYWLYALSNAGSMFALLSYPFLFEPVFTTHQQAQMWSWGYLAFRGAVRPGGACGRAMRQRRRPGGSWKPSKSLAGDMYSLWLVLPACASALLLAITNHISQNVAAIPFLWVLPLSLYLLTFILCFEGSGWYRRNPYLQLLAVALGCDGLCAGRTSTGNVPIQVVVPLFSLGLFTCCMVCHGELARLKPHPRYLTHFYLMIAAGGALGGLVVGLVAPHVFNGFYEMPLGLVACAALVLSVLKTGPGARMVPALDAAGANRDCGADGGAGGVCRLAFQQSMSGVRLRVRNFYGELTVRDSGPPTDRCHADPDPRHHQTRRPIPEPGEPRPADHLLRP